MAHSYGYLKDPPDHRDVKFHLARFPYLPKKLPESVDLRPLCSPVRDQGNLGSCTAFAIGAGMREFLQIKSGTPLTEMSPLWLYYKERVFEGTRNEDSGAYPRDGFKVMQQLGCAREQDCKYNISRFTKRPSWKAGHYAKNFKITSYQRLGSIQEIVQCLAGGYGVVIGFDVYDSFETIGSSGQMPIPEPGERLLGGHAVFVVGYGNGNLIVKNSWGESWGDKGYFYMPTDFVTDRNVSDMWTALL